MGTSELLGDNLTNCWEVTCDGLVSHPGGVEILLVSSYYVETMAEVREDNPGNSGNDEAEGISDCIASHTNSPGKYKKTDLRVSTLSTSRYALASVRFDVFILWIIV